MERDDIRNGKRQLGNSQKDKQVISGNIVKEEWIYKNTWLYFENNTLVEWGPDKINHHIFFTINV